MISQIMISLNLITIIFYLSTLGNISLLLQKYYWLFLFTRLVLLNQGFKIFSKIL